MRTANFKVAVNGKLEKVMTVYCERNAALLKNGSVVKLDKNMLLNSTGLADENGEEIYEGNIVAFSDSVYNANMDEFLEAINTATVVYVDNRFTLANFDSEGMTERIIRESNIMLVRTLENSVIAGHICEKRGDK